MSYKTPRGRVPTLDFDWRVLAVVWMRPGGGGTSGGSLRSSRQAVAWHPFTRSWATMPPEFPPPPGLLWHMFFNDGHNSLHSFSTTPLLNKYYNNAKVWSCPFICSEVLEKPMCGWINNTPHRICDIRGYGKTVTSVVALPAHVWNFPDFGTRISETLSLMLCCCILSSTTKL